MKTEYVVLLVAIAVSTAYGLDCYVCEGTDTLSSTELCADKFSKPDSLLQTCNATEVFCKKEKIGANHLYTTVERSCAVTCEKKNLAYVKRITCCDSDGCNGASDVTAGAGLLLLVTMTIFMM